jgi:hypothetical protein
MLPFAFIFFFALVLVGCAKHPSSSVAHVDQAPPGHFGLRLDCAELGVISEPCSVPEGLPHRRLGICWVFTDATNGVITADHVSLVYGSLDGALHVSQKEPLHGLVTFAGDHVNIALKVLTFPEGTNLDHYEEFRLNGTYKIVRP